MKDLENTASDLSGIKKENPFRVPDNYFDDFSARLQKRIYAEKTAVHTQKNSIVRYLKPVIGIAAGLTLIISLTIWQNKKQSDLQAASGLNGENQEDLLLAGWVERVDENSFYNLIDKSKVSSQLNDDDLVNYVNINSSDYEIYTETSAGRTGK